MSSAAFTHLPLDGSAFGQPRGEVTLLQTHIGCVYLVGEYAFKLKKHVKFDFLDFTTLEQRKWACDREVQLNRRLCPDLYLGVVPVIQACSGRCRVEPSPLAPLPQGERGPPAQPAAGERIVDYAVWMKRLPPDRMLNELLGTPDAVSAADARAIGETLAAFYKTQRGTTQPGGLGDLDAVRSNVDENLREGRALDRSVLSAASLALIERRALYFLDRHGEVIRSRARDGFVVDGHGDLRSENICLPLNSKPYLFDCIEFNDRFRVCDSALDVAFLVMDLESRGRPELAGELLDVYRKGCDAALPEPLLNFYLGYRAFVKAKVAAWIAADESVDAPQRAASRAQARDLFDLSVRYALKNQKALIVFCGPAGSGKSTLASELASRLKCAHLATDIIRDEILPKGLSQEQRYAPNNAFRVYATLQSRADKELAAGRIVVADGTFTTSSTRERFAEMAKNAGAAAILVWADCPDDKIAAHLVARAAAGNTFGSEANAEISAKQRAAFEKPKAREGFATVCRVDTGVDLNLARADAWEQVLSALKENV
ncbi:MAG TPA: AAA family ATPase [Planctomycetota bacterium]|nr:AAA family ATPase [Planctomycetota bacterium]